MSVRDEIEKLTGRLEIFFLAEFAVLLVKARIASEFTPGILHALFFFGTLPILDSVSDAQNLIFFFALCVPLAPIFFFGFLSFEFLNLGKYLFISFESGPGFVIVVSFESFSCVW